MIEPNERSDYPYRIAMDVVTDRQLAWQLWVRENINYGDWSIMHHPTFRQDGKVARYRSWITFRHYEDAFAYQLRWG